jgi:mRNA interferase MazF
MVATQQRRPERGEIWWVNLDPTLGVEQAGRRPAVIVSTDSFQRIQNRLVVIVPMSRVGRPFRFHLRADPNETGLASTGWIMCDQPRTISTQRLLDSGPAGRAAPGIMTRVDALLRALHELP